jgi:hypothetical protein
MGRQVSLQARTATTAIQEKCDDQYRYDQPDRSDSPSGTHPPIQTAAAAEQKQENYDYEYGIHRYPCEYFAATDDFSSGDCACSTVNPMMVKADVGA